ncbi:MAG: hypothetical protein Kow0098_29010 [Ignavibacteriaceae bacterium]
MKSRKQQLKDLFKEGGCFIVPDPVRQKKEGQNYRKGYEIRFSVYKTEEKKLRQVLKESELNPGKGFKKGNKVVVPVYGKESYLKFKKLTGIRHTSKK